MAENPLLPIDNEAFGKTRAACETAWDAARAQGDKAMEALRKADLVRSETARETFVRQAKLAILAADNWQRAAQNLADLLGAAGGP
jgi:hypothetical protein